MDTKLDNLFLNIRNTIFTLMQEKQVDIDALTFDLGVNRETFVNNFSKRIELDDIAEELKINKFTLAREVKAHTSKTIFEYINIFRCLEAEKLIKNGFKVKDAAKSCGFNNFSYFTKTFKRFTGITPKKYAIRYKN